MPSYQTPLDAAFRRDSDLETSVTSRDGSTRRVGPRHYRLQMRLGWEALSYALAHAILSEVSQDPITLVPRTRQPSDPSYLSEHSYDCKLVSDLPASAQLHRRSASGESLARLEIELRALDTVSELPDALAGGVEQITP